MKSLSPSKQAGQKSATLLLALTCTLGLAACSSSDDESPADAAGQNGAVADAQPGAPDAMAPGIDAMTATPRIPSWTREDIQPASPRFGEVYGLSEFDGEILVAVLVQGF